MGEAAERKLAWTLEELSKSSKICRSSLYEDIKTGRLRAVKRGRSTLILDADARAYLASFPEIRQGEAA